MWHAFALRFSETLGVWFVCGAVILGVFGDCGSLHVASYFSLDLGYPTSRRLYFWLCFCCSSRRPYCRSDTWHKAGFTCVTKRCLSSRWRQPASAPGIGLGGLGLLRPSSPVPQLTVRPPCSGAA